MRNMWKIQRRDLKELTKDMDNDTILIDVLHKGADESMGAILRNTLS